MTDTRGFAIDHNNKIAKSRFSYRPGVLHDLNIDC